MSLLKLKSYNQKYTGNNFYGTACSSAGFEFTDRKSGVVLSAPHATKTFVGGRVKASDLYTGALVEYLGEKNGISTLIRTAYLPRQYLADEFLDGEVLKNGYFLDIHGMRDNGEFELAVGTGLLSCEMYSRELAFISETAARLGISYRVNHPQYSGIAKMTAFTARLQRKFEEPRILQFEFSRSLRDFYTCPDNVLTRTLPFLEELIFFLNYQKKLWG